MSGPIDRPPLAAPEDAPRKRRRLVLVLLGVTAPLVVAILGLLANVRANPGYLLTAFLGTVLLAAILALLAWIAFWEAQALRDAHAELSASKAKLAASLARNEAIIASIPDTLSRVDRNGHFLEVHAGPSEPLPVPAEDLVGRDVREFVPPHVAAEMTAVIERALTTGEVQTLRYRVGYYEGKERVFEARLMRAGADELLILRRDFTQTVKLEERLQAATRVAALGTLAGSVGHEVNNPLTYVLGNVDLAIELVGDLAHAPHAAAVSAPLAELEELLREAQEGAERVRDIVRQLKMFTGSGEERVTRIDARSVVEGALRMMKNQLTSRARLTVTLDKGPRVDATESGLAQVVVALLANAVDAIPEGHASEHEIAVRTFTDDARQVVIEVADTGRGIEPADLPRLYDPFFTTKAVNQGTGLGLAICHAIVRGFGGSIEADSIVGHGARFRVTLPPSLASRSNVATLGGSGEEIDAMEQKAPARPHVLVVDDEPMVARVIARGLASRYDVEIATDARSALTRFTAGERFAAVLCDLMMPELTGMELHGEVEKTDPEQAKRFIFMTGGAFNAAARAFLDTTENGRIDKPIDRRALDELLARIAPTT